MRSPLPGSGAWAGGLLALLLLAACVDEEDPTLDRDGDGSPAGEDCDDFDATRTPGAPEICNDRDDDCDSSVDEDAIDAIAWATDADLDGYGDDADVIVSCVAVGARVAAGGDCDDTDPTVSPGIAERCDGVDQDCDGVVDDDALDATDWYTDADADGYGDAASGVSACEAPESALADGTDCDDGDATVHPGAAEVCDAVDTDCDGLADAGATDGTWWWPDADADGYGDPTGTPALDCVAEGRAANRLDCDDADAAKNPVAGGCGLDMQRDAADAAASITGPEADYQLGAALSIGDVDGDGLNELLVGGPESPDGVVYVFGGVRGGESVADARAVLTGSEDCALGSAIAVGDLDGDGIPDLVAGAPDEPTGGASGGAAFVFPGPVTGDRSVEDALPIYATSARDSVGHALAVLNDTTGDGVADLLLAGPDWAGVGVVYLVPGPLTDTTDLTTAITFTGIGGLDRAGVSVAGGDLDGDGLDELVVGASGAPDVYIVEGGATENASFLYETTIGDRGGAYLTGYDVTVVPDVDGDGLPDVFIGGPAYSGGLGNYPGEAWLVRGTITGRRTLPADAWATYVSEAGDLGGWSVAGGDLDDDGATDLVLGAPEDGTGGVEAGAVHIVWAAATGTWTLADLDAKTIGYAPGLQLGSEVAVGDLDGDGFSELAVGAPGEAIGGDDAGAALVFWGGAR